MNKKKKYFIYWLMISVLILTFVVSCRNKPKDNEAGEPNSSQTKESASVSKDSIKMDVTEQVSVDISAFDNYDAKQEKIRVSHTDVDLKAVKALAFPEDKSEQTLDSPYDSVNRLMTEQETMLIYDGSILVGYTKAWDIYNDFLGIRTAEDIEIQTPTDEALDFMSIEEVRQKVTNLIKDIGVGFEPGEIKVEAYTQVYFAKLVDKLKKNPNYAEYIKEETFARDWSTTDAVYYAEVGFVEQEIPIEKEGFSLLDESSIMGMQMQVYMTKQGIQFISVNALMDKGDTEEVELCSVQEGIDAIAGKYKNIVTDEKVKVVDVKLEYNILPTGMNGELYLTPVLKFDTQNFVEMSSTTNTQSENITFQDTIRVNAETGRLVE